MKKILYFATVDMFTRTGGGIATHAFYNALNEIFPNKVDLYHAEDYLPKKLSENENIIPSKRISNFQWLKNILSGHLHRFYPSFINYITENKDDYSICIINGSTYIGDTIRKIKELGIKIVVIHHNFEVEYIKANRSITTLWGLLLFVIRKQEERAYKLADLNLFLTKDDLLLFQKEYGKTKAKCDIIGIFELEESKLNTEIEKKGNGLVISGALNFKQTVTGIKDFFENYYPLVFDLVQNEEFVITGRNPGNYIVNIPNRFKNVKIIQNPIDIYKIINECKIYICPINVGGGLKLRILDGLRLGLPILTHECSARGYDMFYDKPYFKIYKDKVSFENGFKELLDYVASNEFTRKTIIDDYLMFFSFSSGTNRLKQLINEIND